MPTSAVTLLSQLLRLAEQESLQPDLGRALRATVVFMVPLLLPSPAGPSALTA